MFLIILSMTDNKESGLLFEHNGYNSFLCTGITLGNFSMDGRTPNEKDALNIAIRRIEISFFNSFRILAGRPFGPLDFSLFTEDII